MYSVSIRTGAAVGWPSVPTAAKEQEKGTPGSATGGQLTNRGKGGRKESKVRELVMVVEPSVATAETKA